MFKTDFLIIFLFFLFALCFLKYRTLKRKDVSLKGYISFHIKRIRSSHNTILEDSNFSLLKNLGITKPIVYLCCVLFCISHSNPDILLHKLKCYTFYKYIDKIE